MKKLSTLYEAAEFASTICSNWNFATSEERYDTNRLLRISQTHDCENPADEDSFYLVSPAGSIGFCEDSDDIDWLFLSDSCEDEILPVIFETASQINFCSQCGSAVISGARFCGHCGKAI